MPNFLNNQPAIATTDILPSTFVQIDSTVNFGVKQAVGLNVPICGISHEGTRVLPNLVPTLGGTGGNQAVIAGDGVGIYRNGDVCLVEVGSAAVAAGDLLRNDGTGKAITAVAGAWYGAKAWEAGQPGDKIQVEVLIGQLA